MIREKEFDKIVKELFELYKKKNADYGDSFHNLYQDCGDMYPVTRIYEKAKRGVQLLLHGQQVKEESLRDTIKDMAVYCILTLIEKDENINKNKLTEDRNSGESCTSNE